MRRGRVLLAGACVAALAAWGVVAVLATRPRSAAKLGEGPAHDTAVPGLVPAPPPRRAPSGDVLPDRPSLPYSSDLVAFARDHIPGEVPDDARGAGGASLRLRLLDLESRTPVAMQARLWRLDVAEDKWWTAGDHVQASLSVAKTGTSVDGLPPGRYRLQCLDLRAGAADPPEFTLSDGDNVRDVAVADCRWFRVRLRLYDERGGAVRRAERQLVGGDGSSADPDLTSFPPKWTTPRRPKVAGADYLKRCTFGVACGTHDQAGTVDADAEGCFGLETRRERGEGSRSERTFTYRVDGRGDVDWTVSDDRGVDTTFVGLAVPPDVLAAGVVQPDGSPPARVAIVEARCDAVPFAWDLPADAWRTVPIHVKASVRGYWQLAFDWTPATAGERHALVPIRPR